MRSSGLAVLILLGLGWGCASAPPGPSDLLIPPEARPWKPALSAAEVTQDLAVLRYALERGYAGRAFLPGSVFADTLSELSKLGGAMSQVELADRIDSVLFKVPDCHLHAQAGNRLAPFRKQAARKPGVGPNIAAAGGAGRFWLMREERWGRAHALLLGLTSFPTSRDPRWLEPLEELEKRAPRADVLVLDLRGNYGGDLWAAEQIAYFLHGGPFRSAVAQLAAGASPEALALYSNADSAPLAGAAREKRVPPSYLLDLYNQSRARFAESLKHPRQEFTYRKLEAVGSDYPWKPGLRPFRKPIYLLTDGACASTCELFVAMLETHPSARRVGEPTNGCVQFGNPGYLLLPHSGILVVVPTSATVFADHRFVERVGLKPRFSVSEGHDALAFARTLASRSGK